jgi:hypothetical protein
MSAEIEAKIRAAAGVKDETPVMAEED